MGDDKKLSQPGAQPLIFLLYTAGVTALAIPAMASVADTALWDDDVIAMGNALIIIPSLMLIHSVSGRLHSLTWSIYWVWSLLFLGLAPAYQLGAGRFPWGARPSDDEVGTAQQIILAMHVVVVVAYAIRVWSRRQPTDGDKADATDRGLRESTRLRKLMLFLIFAHVAVAVMFTVLMGTAMFSGRFAFQAQLGARGGIPGFGTMYFFSNAGAMAIPAMAIVLKKKGLDLPGAAIFLSIVMSFVVTNPLIGSRFLTGSFLVAVVAAAFSANVRRFIPGGLVLAFVTIFPTLDILRGDGTGAARVELSGPAKSLLTFDFDAFEMLTRQVMMDGDIGAGLPGRVELLIAPFFRWIPVLSQMVQGDASGPVVARSTGMSYTNVSMPLWGEANLIGSWVGLVIAFTALGILLGSTHSLIHSRSIFGALIEFPVAALLFIILRGSLYEVLGYLLLVVGMAWFLARAERLDRAEPVEVEPKYHIVAPRTRRN
ncbi:hypothetical protein [Arthrobacter subterraneus]|uniref:hypothetical protein n=1 Tax=Arthrobacter subterraneus TaxID=335973 RepID=UPI000B80AAC4|nr:hypothetical protein [Arthrobacter subterraneus]